MFWIFGHKQRGAAEKQTVILWTYQILTGLKINKAKQRAVEKTGKSLDVEN